MYGLSSSGKESIGYAIEKMFDALSYKFLGNIPKLRDKSPFFASSSPFSLANIFVQATGNNELTHIQRDVLRSLLSSSYGYMESLRHKTSSNVIESVDALAREARISGNHISVASVAEAIAIEMDKARSHLKLIAEAETTKTRNMGHTTEILNTAQKQGISDPTVYFIIVRASACSECVRLHMLPDQVTPKVYKMSELSMGWHKRGDDTPSACGEHPNCRCSLTQLSDGYGFKGGYTSFISLNYDEYARQRA